VDLYNAFLSVETRRGGVAVLDARVEEFFISGRWLCFIIINYYHVWTVFLNRFFS